MKRENKRIERKIQNMNDKDNRNKKSYCGTISVRFSFGTLRKWK